MKIYSWNMLYRNRELDRAFEFIQHADFDIFCLQEVPETFLARLQMLPYHITFCTDVERLSRNHIEHIFIVILSKHPIETHGEIPYPDYWSLLPLRTRLFIHLMPYRFFSKIRNRNALFADIRVQGAPNAIRIFNLHLILARPAWRLKEFEMAMTQRDPARPTIVCGDFNTLQALHITPLNWILGGRLCNVAFYNRERTHIERRFVEHKLFNTLAGGITHPISQSQLDHILVSNSFSIKNAVILPDRIGSDHHPIMTEVA